MKTLFAKTGLLAIAGLLAVSCASSPENYRVELMDRPEQMREPVQKQETINTYEKFPYIDFRASRL